jgi:hypothetical protein
MIAEVARFAARKTNKTFFGFYITNSVQEK